VGAEMYGGRLSAINDVGYYVELPDLLAQLDPPNVPPAASGGAYLRYICAYTHNSPCHTHATNIRRYGRKLAERAAGPPTTAPTQDP
jgi:hypothetical protein